MLILALDTSGKMASCALLQDGVVLDMLQQDSQMDHSRLMLPLCEQLLQKHGLTFANVDVYAAVVGPGSFTGVRIGVAALKGLVFSEEKNCVPVSTLESMAYNVAGLPGSEDYVVCPAMDARRNQVYTAAFQWEEGEVHRLMEDKAIPIPELLEALESFGLPVLFVGDGASLCYTAAAETTLDATLAPEQLRYQNAVAVAACAAAKLEAGESPVGSDDILPVYLRAPQAERELKKRKEQEQ